MHDISGVRLKIQNNEGVVHTFEVDEHGFEAAPVTVEPISYYRHEGFGRIPTYVCDCGMEYWAWQDVLDHLALLVPDGCWHMSYTADAVGRDICQNCGQVFDDGVPVYP
jgi:hypothetical protein